jgi:23S rRNA (adenine2503-C2)-methyltransferase
MPFNLRHPLKEVSEALVYYHQKTGRRITVEYILFGGFNDSLSDARDLALFCRKFPVKINLIEYNPVRNTIFTKTEPEKLRQFANWLEDKNMVVNVRMSRGKDIDAACGQLAGKSSGIEV